MLGCFRSLRNDLRLDLKRTILAVHDKAASIILSLSKATGRLIYQEVPKLRARRWVSEELGGEFTF